MRPLKLGTFIPLRPENHLVTGNAREGIGCLRADIHAPLTALLRTAQHVDLTEGLNIHKALVLNGEVWCGAHRLNDLDAFVWYCEVDRRPGSFDLEVLKTLSRHTRVIRDPTRFEIALDKYAAHLRLMDAGVRVPEFVLFDFEAPERMRDLLDKWGAAVLKPRRGGWGKGVTLIESRSQLRDIVGYVRGTAGRSPDQGFFLERYYDNDLDRWASLTMVDGEVIYGYRKKAERLSEFGGGKKKVLDVMEKGGGVVPADVTEAHVAEAKKACAALGLGLIGFDMIWVDGAPMVIDENTSPGNYTDLYAHAGKDPAVVLANWILREAREK